MKDYEIVFESDNILYVKLTNILIDEYLLMVNDPDVARNIRKDERIFTYQDELEWVNSQLEKDVPCFSMVSKKTNDFIGNVEIKDINDGIGLIGIVITPRNQNKHFGTEAMNAIMNYGYNTLGLNGFELYVYAFNKRAIHCYEKVGFIKSGLVKGEDEIHMICKK